MVQKQATWADLTGFCKLTGDKLKTAFNDAVGGAYFDVGTFKDVTIESIEPKLSMAGNLYARIVFTNDEGAKISSNVMLTSKDGDLHFTYKRLAAAVVVDPSLRMEFFANVASANPAILDALRGLKVTIKIAHGKEGFIIKKNSLTGGFLLIDIETQQPYEEVANVEFESYSEAKEKADELGFKRCYNEVDKVTKGSLDAIKTNEDVIREVLHAPEAKVANLTTATSAAKRPTL